MTDDEMVAGILNGDKAAFSECYSSHKQGVERSASFFLGDDPELPEAVGDTFRAALREIQSRGKPDLPLGPWLSILAVRRCLPVMARRRRQLEEQTRNLESLAGKVQVLREITADEKERVNFMVRGEIDEIPEPHHQIMTLYELEGLNLLEMAKRLSCAWVTLINRLYSAREVLAEKVKSQLPPQ